MYRSESSDRSRVDTVLAQQVADLDLIPGNTCGHTRPSGMIPEQKTRSKVLNNVGPAPKTKTIEVNSSWLILVRHLERELPTKYLQNLSSQKLCVKKKMFVVFTSQIQVNLLFSKNIMQNLTVKVLLQRNRILSTSSLICFLVNFLES